MRIKEIITRFELTCMQCFISFSSSTQFIDLLLPVVCSNSPCSWSLLETGQVDFLNRQHDHPMRLISSSTENRSSNCDLRRERRWVDLGTASAGGARDGGGRLFRILIFRWEINYVKEWPRSLQRDTCNSKCYEELQSLNYMSLMRRKTQIFL